ncbi:hypothetical protein ACFFRR_008782 [Megaselia abdita]
MEETSRRRKKSKNSLPKLFDGTYFVVKSILDDKITVKCRACNKELNGYKTSTGNFFSHIKRIHPEILDECKSYLNSLSKSNHLTTDFYFPLDGTENQTSDSMSMTMITPKVELDEQSVNSYCEDDKSFIQKPFIFQKNSCSTLNFLLSELLPVSILTNKEIHGLLQDNVPSVDMVIEELNHTFNQISFSVNRFLSNKTVSIIVDIGKKVIAVLATVLDEYFLRKNILLGVQKFSNSENFENVSNIVASVLSSFDISLDNVSNIVYGKGVSFNNIKYEQDYEIVAEPKKHRDFEKVKNFRNTIQSSVYLLDLVYQDALEHIRNSNEIQTFQIISEKLRIFWTKCKTDEQEFPIPKNLHWRNTFQPISFLLKNKHLIDDPFTPDEWSYLIEVSDLVKFVYQASMILENELCLGYVLPTVLSLISKIKDKKIETCRFFQSGILFGIENRFSNILNFESPQNIDFLVATISHPKFKMVWAPLEQFNYLVGIFTNECQHLFTKASEDSTSNDFFFDFTSSPTWSFVQEEINDYLQNRNYTISCLHGFPTIKKMFIKSNTTLTSTVVLGEVLRKTEQKVGYVEMEDLQKMVFINENKQYF